MSNFILIIFSILLTATLSLAGINYASKIQDKNIDNAKIDVLKKESNEIIDAANMWFWTNNKQNPTSVSSLVSSNYLKQPPSENWSISNGVLTLNSISEAQCLALNKKLGFNFSTVPACSSVTISQSGICCSS